MKKSPYRRRNAELLLQDVLHDEKLKISAQVSVIYFSMAHRYVNLR